MRLGAAPLRKVPASCHRITLSGVAAPRALSQRLALGEPPSSQIWKLSLRAIQIAQITWRANDKPGFEPPKLGSLPPKVGGTQAVNLYRLLPSSAGSPRLPRLRLYPSHPLPATSPPTLQSAQPTDCSVITPEKENYKGRLVPRSTCDTERPLLGLPSVLRSLRVDGGHASHISPRFGAQSCRSQGGEQRHARVSGACGCYLQTGQEN